MIKRPILSATLAYILGILAGVNFKIIIVLVLSFVFILISIISFINKKIFLIILGLIIIFNTGVIYSNYKYNFVSKISHYENNEVNITGTLLSNSNNNGDKTTLLVKVRNIDGKKIKNELAIVNCYKLDNANNLDYGDLIQIKGIVELPSEERNPGGFNYKKYLKTKDIYTIISAEQVSLVKKSGGEYSSIVKLSIEIRKNFTHIIDTSLPMPESSMMESLVLSKTDLIDDKIKEDFRAAGLSHIMAVSGMNVGILVLSVMFVADKLRLKRCASTILTTIILIFFALITGATPAIMRAVIMGIIVLYAKALGRRGDILTSIAISALLILLYNPLAIYDVGFELSYMATLGLVLFYSKVVLILKIFPKWACEVLGVTLSAQIGVTPIIVYYFNNISLISPISNLLAATLSDIILMLGLCMTMLGQIHIYLAQFIGMISYWPVWLLLKIAEKSAQVPYSSIMVSTPSFLLILFYYLFFTGVLLYWDKIKAILFNKTFLRASGVALAVMLIFTITKNKCLEINFLDVGQGDAAFISTPHNKNIFIDCGGHSTASFDPGEKTIVPFLLDKGIKKIDIIMLSHTDADHICGLDAIIKDIGVKSLVVSDNIKLNNNIKNKFDEYQKKGINVIYIKNNGKINVEKNIFFQAYGAGKNFEKVNDKESLVYKLRYDSKSFLFAGDISTEVEDELIKDHTLNADVLKVAHHGSKESSSNEFLKDVKPSIAVISVGINNFGHPSNAVLERLKTNGIRTFRTDESGCVSIFSNGKSLEVTTMSGDKMNI